MAIKKGQMTDNETGDLLYFQTSYDMVTDKPTNFPPSSHNHDDRYYTEAEMNTKLTAKLDTTGNASNVTNTFTQASTLANLTTGEKLSVSFGKIMKAIADLISHIGNKSNPHAVTKSQVGLGNVTNDAQVKRSEMGVSSGVATLDTTGKVPSSQLPSYVDDVLEYTNKAGFPTTGESGKIYIDKATNITYRWSGTAYVEISPSLALGETSSTAYSGDKGKSTTDKVNAIIAGTTKVPKATNADTVNGLTVKTAVPANAKFTDTVYTHPSNSSSYTSGLYKITVDKYGHVISAVAVQKADITNLGIPGSVITSASEIKLASGKTVETAINEILSVLEKAVFYDDSVG